MKKIPLRKCLATNELCPKKDLLRVVKNNEGKVFFDYSSKANGRGAYIKCSVEAIELARKKKVLDRALETSVPDEVYEALLKEANARKN
ncbi:MAG: YlxR family protein [Bacilli bacterium]|nr:YlxR family protein [Bacillales bacterium]MDY2575382.1 YlxR family protein [Bacilli bacterium]